MRDPLEFTAALVVLLAVAALRFNTPSWIRNTTTAARHTLGTLAYVALAGALYALLVLGAGMPPTLCVLLVVTGFTWVPPLPSLERSLRRLVHRFMDKSHDAQRLADFLFHAECHPSPEILSEVRCSLRSRGYDADHSWLPVAEPARVLWLKTAILFQIVRSWPNEKRYRRFLGEAQREFDTLRQRFDQLSLRMSRTIDAVEGLGEALPATLPSPGSAGNGRRADAARMETALRSVVTVMLTDVREDIAFFLRNLCMFTARGVMATALGPRGRHRRLHELGFASPRPPTSLLGRLAYTFVIFVVGLTTLLMVLPARDSWLTWATRVPMIALIHSVAMAVAIAPKRGFGFANTSLSGREPTAFFVAAGLAASLCSMPISLVFRASQSGWSLAWSGYWSEWQWMLMPFVTGSLTAFLVQDRRWASAPSERSRRLRDGLVLSIGMAAALTLVRWLLTSRSGSAGEPLWITATIVGFTLAIGFAIGYSVPYGFRETPGDGVSSLDTGGRRLRRSAVLDQLTLRGLPPVPGSRVE